MYRKQNKLAEAEEMLNMVSEEADDVDNYTGNALKTICIPAADTYRELAKIYEEKDVEKCLRLLNNASMLVTGIDDQKVKEINSYYDKVSDR